MNHKLSSAGAAAAAIAVALAFPGAFHRGRLQTAMRARSFDNPCSSTHEESA